jgi:tripeptide aminopeptidase
LNCFLRRLFVLSFVLAGPMCYAEGPALVLQRPSILAAMAAATANQPEMIAKQIRICEIPAPPFQEMARAKELARIFKDELSLENVRIDEAGNVLGDRPGKTAHPHLVVAAHLDTVFPPETNVHVTQEGNVLKGPGIGDDCAGLTTLIGTVAAMNEAKVQTNGTVTFVADVGEEGLGDLRGMKELFGKTMQGRIDEFVSIEPGQPNRISNVGVGSYRYRVTYTGPGGHSYGAFGMANPIHALGRAIAKISDIQVPTTPKTTFNVGRIGGGTSVNAIPFEAWLEFDERSLDTRSLAELDATFRYAVQSALDEENARWGNKVLLNMQVQQEGNRPAGLTDPNSPIVQTAMASIRALHLGEPQLGAGSSDANLPMHLGIPAIVLGAGGLDRGAHSLNETDDVTESWKGVQNAILTTVLLTEDPASLPGRDPGHESPQNAPAN